MSAVAKGVSMGVAAGVMTYALSNASMHQKKKIKRSTEKAIKAVGDVINGISYMMH